MLLFKHAMIKELILAILLGALLGFGATGGYYSLKNSQSKAITPPTEESQTTPTPTLGDTITPGNDNKSNSNSENEAPKSTNASHTLTVSSPENESLLTTPVTEIKGSTSPNSLVVLQTTKKTFTAKADKSGNFSFTNVELEGGINLIQISAVDQEDNQADYELLLTYSSAKI